MTGNNTHVVAVWVGFAGHSSQPGPPGGRGFTRTFTPKEVSPYDWQVGGGWGAVSWGRSWDSGIGAWIRFHVRLSWGCAQCGNRVPREYPQTGSGSCSPPKDLASLPLCFLVKALAGTTYTQGEGARTPPLRARRAERSAASLNHRIFSPFSLPHHHPRPTSPRR